jgi:hypothetical protein
LALNAMTKERKYTIFVLAISICYLALPYMSEVGSRTQHNAEKTVTVFILGSVAQLFYTFLLDILFIVAPLTYMLISTKATGNKLNARMLLLTLFFATICYDNAVCFNRFSDDIVLGYNTKADLRNLNIVHGGDKSIIGFLTYTYNMSATYITRMDKHLRDEASPYLPGIAMRTLVGMFLIFIIVCVFIYKNTSLKTPTRRG